MNVNFLNKEVYLLLYFWSCSSDIIDNCYDVLLGDGGDCWGTGEGGGGFSVDLRLLKS